MRLGSRWVKGREGKGGQSAVSQRGRTKDLFLASHKQLPLLCVYVCTVHICLSVREKKLALCIVGTSSCKLGAN